MFFSSTEKGKIDDDSKISASHISFKNYQTCEKILDKFDMKNMGDYHDYYLKIYIYCYQLMFLKSLLTRA